MSEFHKLKGIVYLKRGTHVSSHGYGYVYLDLFNLGNK